MAYNGFVLFAGLPHTKNAVGAVTISGLKQTAMRIYT